MLTYQSQGTGIPVVLLHAFPLSHAMWKDLIGPLSRSARVIAPDLPGFGTSPLQSKPSIAGMAREVADLLDHLQVEEPVFLGGLSMGGYVAFEILRQFPGRIRGLGLFSTRAAADTPEAKEGRTLAAEKIRSSGLSLFSREILPKLLGKTALAAQPAVVQEVTAMVQANSRDGVADALIAMAGRRDSGDLLDSIRVPVLIVAGEEDIFIPVADSQSLQRRIQRSRLEVIPQAGHLVSIEQPELFQKTLERFLSETISTSRSHQNFS